MFTNLLHILDKVGDKLWKALANPDASSLTNLVVALIAWWIFTKTRKNQVKDAAVLSVLDIRAMAEQAAKIKTYIEMPSFQSHTFHLLSISSAVGNSWEKNRHLFTSALTSEDIALLDNFVSQYVQVRSYYDAAVKLYEANLVAKAQILQQKVDVEIVDFRTKNPRGAIFSPGMLSNDFAEFHTFDFVFSAGFYINQARSQLLSMTSVLGSHSFAKLTNLSSPKWWRTFF